MSDLISRQAMIDKMRRHRALFCKNRVEFIALPKDEKARVDEIDNCIADLINAPSTDPERKWIPVTEALPEEKGEYLVSYHPCHWNAVSEKVVVGMDTFRGKTTWAKMKYQKVIAWMPLPEPWRGE